MADLARSIGNIRMDAVRRSLFDLAVLTIIFVSATQLRSFQLESSLPLRAGLGDSTRQTIYLTALALVVLASRPLHHPAKMIAIPIPILLLLFWCAISVTWALEPSISMRRLIFTTLIVWIVCRTVDEMEPERLLATLRFGLLVMLILNWGAVLLFHGGIHAANASDDHTLAGSWRGIIPHKNIAGPVCSVTMFVYCFSGRRVHPLLRLAVVVAAGYFLYRTQSKTSLGFTAMALLGGYAFRFYDARYRALLLPVIALAGVAGTLAGTIFGPRIAADLASSEDAFTGRIQIWHVLANYIADHPLKGAGFQSFWNIGPDSPVYEYARNWVAQNVVVGHCGFLDVTAQIGIPGVILTVTCLFILPLARLFSIRGIPRDTGALAVAILLFAFGHNFTETTMLERDAFLNVMIMMAAAMAYKIQPQFDVVRRPRRAMSPALARATAQ